MLSWPYSNAFFYFRGPSSTSGDAAIVSRQVEDNTTKALMNVLQLGGPAVASSWLDSIGIAQDQRENRDWQFFLQGGPKSCRAPSRRLVVITAGDDAASSS